MCPRVCIRIYEKLFRTMQMVIDSFIGSSFIGFTRKRYHLISWNNFIHYAYSVREQRQTQGIGFNFDEFEHFHLKGIWNCFVNEPTHIPTKDRNAQHCVGCSKCLTKIRIDKITDIARNLEVCH